MPEETLRKNSTLGDIYCVSEQDLDWLIYEIVHQNSYLQDFLILSPGDVVFDVGANIGVFSLFALQQCDYDAVIYSFEPIPSNFSCLSKNLSRFNHNVHLYNLAMGDSAQDCEVTFTMFGGSSVTPTYRPNDKLISNYRPFLNYETLLKLLSYQKNALYYQLRYLPFLRRYLIQKNYKKVTAETKLTCRLSSLGRFIKEHPINAIDLIKIDVEGAEYDVLMGINPEQFSLIKQFSIEVHDINDRVETIDSFLKEQGYVTECHRNPFFAQFGLNHHMVYAKRP